MPKALFSPREGSSHASDLQFAAIGNSRRVAVHNPMELWLAEGARPGRHQLPVLGIEAQGSAGGSFSPFCRSSIEMPSGERMKAM